MRKKILDEIMGKFGAVRGNGKVASDRTQTLTKEVVHLKKHCVRTGGFSFAATRQFSRLTHLEFV
jgi:hypothetical protein